MPGGRFGIVLADFPGHGFAPMNLPPVIRFVAWLMVLGGTMGLGRGQTPAGQRELSAAEVSALFHDKPAEKLAVKPAVAPTVAAVPGEAPQPPDGRPRPAGPQETIGYTQPWHFPYELPELQKVVDRHMTMTYAQMVAGLRKRGLPPEEWINYLRSSVLAGREREIIKYRAKLSITPGGEEAAKAIDEGQAISAAALANSDVVTYLKLTWGIMESREWIYQLELHRTAGKLDPLAGAGSASGSAVSGASRAVNHDPAAALQGTWTMTEVGGETRPAEAPAMTIAFRGHGYRIQAGAETLEFGDFKLDPTQTPMAITYIMAGEDTGKISEGILELSGGQLRGCSAKAGGNRPTEFVTVPPGSGRTPSLSWTAEKR